MLSFIYIYNYLYMYLCVQLGDIFQASEIASPCLSRVFPNPKNRSWKSPGSLRPGWHNLAIVGNIGDLAPGKDL